MFKYLKYIIIIMSIMVMGQVASAGIFPGVDGFNSLGSKAKKGTASYYTYESCKREGTSGVWTASGEKYDENDLTCAMRRRDWGTKFKVTNLDNGKSVVVRLTDFGPNKTLYEQGRIIDLSKGAFEKIGDLKKGLLNVEVEELQTRR